MSHAAVLLQCAGFHHHCLCGKLDAPAVADRLPLSSPPLYPLSAYLLLHHVAKHHGGTPRPKRSHCPAATARLTLSSRALLSARRLRCPAAQAASRCCRAPRPPPRPPSAGSCAGSWRAPARPCACCCGGAAPRATTPSRAPARGGRVGGVDWCCPARAASRSRQLLRRCPAQPQQSSAQPAARLLPWHCAHPWLAPAEPSSCSPCTHPTSPSTRRAPPQSPRPAAAPPPPASPPPPPRLWARRPG